MGQRVAIVAVAAGPRSGLRTTLGPSADTHTGLRPIWEFFGALSSEILVEAALACTDEADFRRRVREQLGLHAGLAPYPDPGG